MSEPVQNIITAMIDYDRGDAHRIQHFLKVYELSRLIGLLEGLDQETQQTLEVAAIVHDIGIRNALAQYGSDAGPYQEELGPGEAAALLRGMDLPAKLVERVCWLVGHHHTYDNIEGLDYRILIEADFLVNLHENRRSAEAIESAYKNIFRTESGKSICRAMYGLE